MGLFNDLAKVQIAEPSQDSMPICGTSATARRAFGRRCLTLFSSADKAPVLFYNLHSDSTWAGRLSASRPRGAFGAGVLLRNRSVLGAKFE